MTVSLFEPPTIDDTTESGRLCATWRKEFRDAGHYESWIPTTSDLMGQVERAVIALHGLRVYPTIEDVVAAWLLKQARVESAVAQVSQAVRRAAAEGPVIIDATPLSLDPAAATALPSA